MISGLTIIWDKGFDPVSCSTIAHAITSCQQHLLSSALSYTRHPDNTLATGFSRPIPLPFKNTLDTTIQNAKNLLAEIP